MTLDEYVNQPWDWNISQDEDGAYCLTVNGLDDFEMYAATAEELMEERKDALKAYLSAYIAIGKPIPVIGEE